VATLNARTPRGAPSHHATEAHNYAVDVDAPDIEARTTHHATEATPPDHPMTPPPWSTPSHHAATPPTLARLGPTTEAHHATTMHAPTMEAPTMHAHRQPHRQITQ
jgi:hypothetical protein